MDRLLPRENDAETKSIKKIKPKVNHFFAFITSPP